MTLVIEPLKEKSRSYSPHYNNAPFALNSSAKGLLHDNNNTHRIHTPPTPNLDAGIFKQAAPLP